MKKKGFVFGILFLVFFIFQLAPQKAYAAVYGDGFHYTVLGEQATITDYTGIGGEIIIPDTITDDNGSYVVTAIGDQAFYGSNITGVTIPNSITSIGASAFEWCSGLTEVIIPDSVITLGESAFYGCQSLRSAVIGNGVTEIKTCTFYQCFQLGSVTIGESVRIIGSSAFYYCNIAEVNIPNSVITIADRAFMLNGSLSILNLGENVESIGESAFQGNYFLENVNFPGSLTSIGPAAFYNSQSLANIFIPSSVTSIGNHAFSACGALCAIDVDSDNSTYSSMDGVLFDKSQANLIKFPENKFISTYIIPDGVSIISQNAFFRSIVSEIIISDTVTTISENAFADTRGLYNVFIGRGVTNISGNVFNRSRVLTQIDVDSNNTAFSSSNGILYDKSQTTLISYPKGKENSSFTIPNTVSKIGEYAFEGCNLVEVVIPDSVNLIQDGAFYNCQLLTDVTVGSGVNNIGSNAFDNCFRLEAIKFWGDAPELGSYVFNGTRAQFRIYYLYGKSGYGSDTIQAEFSFVTPFYLVTYDSNAITQGAVPSDFNTYLNSEMITVMDNAGGLSREGYTFAGWNTAQDGSGTNFLPGSSFVMEAENVILYAMWKETVYPITAPKVQLVNGTTQDSNQTSMRFVSTIDSLNYSEVGFVISLNNTDPVIGGLGCVTKTTKVVYTSINAGSSLITPKSLGGKYIVALSLNNIPHDSFSKNIYVKPYVKSMDGNISYGEKRVFTVLDCLNK